MNRFIKQVLPDDENRFFRLFVLLRAAHGASPPAVMLSI
jgi:hypothetical protein